MEFKKIGLFLVFAMFMYSPAFAASGQVLYKICTKEMFEQPWSGTVCNDSYSVVKTGDFNPPYNITAAKPITDILIHVEQLESPYTVFAHRLAGADGCITIPIPVQSCQLGGTINQTMYSLKVSLYNVVKSEWYIKEGNINIWDQMYVNVTGFPDGQPQSIPPEYEGRAWCGTDICWDALWIGASQQPILSTGELPIDRSFPFNPCMINNTVELVLFSKYNNLSFYAYDDSNNQPIINGAVHVNGQTFITNSDGKVTAPNIDTLNKDVVIAWGGGARTGQYAGESFDLPAAIDNPFDISMWNEFIYIGSNSNSTVWEYWQVNNSPTGWSVWLGECPSGYKSFGGFAVDGKYLYKNDYCQNAWDRRYMPNQTNNGFRLITEYSDQWGIDVTFPSPNNTEATDYYLYANARYDRSVYKLYAKNATFIGTAVDYSGQLSDDAWAYGVTVNNIYLWLLVKDEYGRIVVQQYRLSDGSYVGEWDTGLNGEPRGIETDGTYFYVIAGVCNAGGLQDYSGQCLSWANLKVYKYWRQYNGTAGYEPMNTVIEPWYYGAYGYDAINGIQGIDCDQVINVTLLHIPTDIQNLLEYQIRVLKTGTSVPVTGAYVIVQSEQDLSTRITLVTDSDGWVNGSISYPLSETYTGTYSYSITVRADGYEEITVFGQQMNISNPVNIRSVYITPMDLRCTPRLYEVGEIWSSVDEDRLVRESITYSCNGEVENPKCISPVIINEGGSVSCYAGVEVKCTPETDDSGNCVIEVKDAAACDATGTYATTYQFNKTCDATYSSVVIQTESAIQMSITELAALGLTGLTGNNPQIVPLFGYGIVLLLPVGLIALTGSIAVGIIAFPVSLMIAITLGLIQANIMNVIIGVAAAIFAYQFFFGRKGGGSD